MTVAAKVSRESFLYKSTYCLVNNFCCDHSLFVELITGIGFTISILSNIFTSSFNSLTTVDEILFLFNLSNISRTNSVLQFKLASFSNSSKYITELSKI